MSGFDLNSIGVLAQRSPELWSSRLAIATLLGVALFIGVSVVIAQTWKHWSFKGVLVSIGNLVWITPILLAIGWVGWNVAPHLRDLERNAAYNPADVTFSRFSEEPGTEFRPAVEPTQLDQWVLSGQVDRGDKIDVPVHGGWRESEAEARNYAQREVLRTIRQDLDLAYPATRGWKVPVPVDQIASAQTENVEVKKKLNLGSIEHDMYRVHLLVELSDKERQAILQSWLPRVQEFRLILVCLLAGMLTICSAAGATCLRLDLKTEGKFRTWLRLATICVVLASSLATQNILAQAELRTLTGIETQTTTTDHST
jgi:hypothetical protein